MSPDYDFCDNRAHEAEAEADRAQLDNVRDRALRSAAAWRAMADRARKTEEDRELRLQTRAAALSETESAVVPDDSHAAYLDDPALRH